jgi:arylsulfatase A-like enzyme
MKTLISTTLKINLLILSFGQFSCSSKTQGDKSAKLELAITQDNRPNILLIYTDDQGTLDAGCFGAKDINTPVLDKLATQGVKFTQAYSHTVCCPSRAALLTGRAPQRSGVNQWTSCNPNDQVGRVMNLKEITIAEHLKENGYKTGLIGKWHLGATMNHGPLDHGFDVFFWI